MSVAASPTVPNPVRNEGFSQDSPLAVLTQEREEQLIVDTRIASMGTLNRLPFFMVSGVEGSSGEGFYYPLKFIVTVGGPPKLYVCKKWNPFRKPGDNFGDNTNYILNSDHHTVSRLALFPYYIIPTGVTATPAEKESYLRDALGTRHELSDVPQPNLGEADVVLLSSENPKLYILTWAQVRSIEQGTSDALDIIPGGRDESHDVGLIIQKLMSMDTGKRERFTEQYMTGGW